MQFCGIGVAFLSNSNLNFLCSLIDQYVYISSFKILLSVSVCILLNQEYLECLWIIKYQRTTDNNTGVLSLVLIVILSSSSLLYFTSFIKLRCLCWKYVVHKWYCKWILLVYNRNEAEFKLYICGISPHIMFFSTTIVISWFVFNNIR